MILDLQHDEIQLLKEWTKKEKLTIIFDKGKDVFNRENCLEIMKGKKEIIILFESVEGTIFGSYHQLLPNDYNEWCNDRNHFAFTLRNKYDLKEKYDIHENNKYAFMITDYLEDDDESLTNILETGYFYSVSMKDKCSINSSFVSKYLNVSKFGIDVFGKDSSNIELKSILFIA